MDEELDLGAITGREGLEQGGRYRLTGIIYHIGISMQSGHYKAEFRDEHGRWWRADDTQVKLAAGPSTGAQASRQEQQRAKKDAYYLIYERVDAEEGEEDGKNGEGEARVPTEEEIKALVPEALKVRLGLNGPD